MKNTSQQHFIAQELLDTMFFSTGKCIFKIKTEESTILHIGSKLIVLIISYTDIRINGYRISSVYDSKRLIMSITNEWND